MMGWVKNIWVCCLGAGVLGCLGADDGLPVGWVYMNNLLYVNQGAAETVLDADGLHLSDGVGSSVQWQLVEGDAAGFYFIQNRSAIQADDPNVNLCMAEDGMTVELSRYAGMRAQWLLHPTDQGMFIINRMSWKNRWERVNLWVPERDAPVQIGSLPGLKSKWILRPVQEMRDVRDG